MALAPEEKLDFSKAGPAGPARFEAGVQGYSASTFRGLGVFQNMPFEVTQHTRIGHDPPACMTAHAF